MRAHYTLFLDDCTMIESSRDAEGEPFEFVTGIGEQIGDKHDHPQHHILDDQQIITSMIIPARPSDRGVGGCDPTTESWTTSRGHSLGRCSPQIILRPFLLAQRLDNYNFGQYLKPGLTLLLPRHGLRRRGSGGRGHSTKRCSHF